MCINVRLFAIIRDKAGMDSFTVELPDGATVADARDQIESRYPATREHMQRAAFAVNQNYVAISTRLKDGDELAVIPPVSGG